ncbi:MAG: GGDEF domain-containing phosphodiesterase [Treponema sp.]|nr:GGDEF domain-containing phosphodiesterase [Treponema sp.]
MIAVIQDVQLFLLFLGGILCFLIFLFSSIVKYQSATRKAALLHIEIVTSLLLFADYFAYTYRGNTSQVGFWMVRISNFLLFALVYVELLGLNKYLRTFVYETKKGGFVRLNLINIISYLGLVSIIISQFTGFVYFIDENNLYQRGPFFFVSFIAPFIIYLLILSVVIQFKKIFPRLIFTSLLMFSILPLVCSIVQGFVYGVSLLNLSIGICAIALFILSLVDQNFFLMQIAFREQATGLPNSYGFIRHVEYLIHEGKVSEYNAFYFDIVRMGLINRRFGGNVGSEILVKYAHILRESMLEEEALGRLGGNFFVAMIKKGNTQSFLDRLQKTDVSISLPNEAGPVTVSISAVAGVYEITPEDKDPEQILNNISMAANIAKNIKHKPYIFLSPELQKEINDVKILQDMIPSCMANREFKPFYQPKVDTTNYTLYGAEALARWEHDGKIIPPNEFIPVLEQNETICEFDFYMLDYVCRDLREWIDTGKQSPIISVNFSRKNLGNPILAEEIFNVVKKYNVPANLVQIEITETLDEYPMEYLKGVVIALKRYGLTTAIDDFGTGSASINLIKEVPFDSLKIDKNFISSVEEKDRKILGHIISMANDVGARAITEGVETEEQLSVLNALGCTKIQGFYFDGPLSKQDFEKRLENPVYKNL